MEPVLRSGRILSAVAQAAERLLSTQSPRELLPDVLRELGTAAGVSRVVLFERTNGTDADPHITQLAEWATADLPDRSHDPSIRNLPMRASGFGRWLGPLERGEPLVGNVRDFPLSEQGALGRHRIQSVAAMPIEAQGRWCGFLSFDDCSDARTWTADELAALQAGAKIIGSALQRCDAEEREASLAQQVRQLQKMEAVGLLAGGVAHDFNNVLTAIGGCCELLRGVRMNAEGLGYVDEIARACDRAARLTRQLLTFSRHQVAQPEVIDLDAAVDELQKMLRRLIGEHIRLVVVRAGEPCYVYADRGQLEQVVVNLSVNARDAMPDGGMLSIEVRKASTRERPANWSAVGSEHVLLIVNDTGAGMDESVRSHLFEPFFTTKAPGKGTGLGLSTVYGIVRQSQGAVEVSSAPGQGSTFRIHFPLATRTPLARAPRTATADSGHETILLVEDDMAVRVLTARLLRGLGYQVLEASNGEAALRLSASHSGPVDLLLTDVIMPGVNGCRLADELSRQRPGIGVLFMSGYTDGEVERSGRSPSDALLLKPFSRDGLGQAVRRALGSAA
ncbi:MAG: ATP-binding protein [Vicinamibacterales bacterium]